MKKALPIFTAAICAYVLSGREAYAFLQTWYDEARAGELVVLAGFLASSVILARRACTPAASKVSVAWIFLLAIGILSALQSPAPLYGLIEAALMGSLVVAGYTLRARAADMADLRQTLILILACGAGVLGLRLCTDFITAAFTQDARGLVSSWLPFINPRFFAKAATWALPILWVAPQLIPAQYRRPIQGICWLAAVAIWSQVIGTGSRGALVGLALSLALVFTLFATAGRTYFKWQISTAIAGAALWMAFAWHFDIDTADRIATAHLSGRELLYAAAWSDIRSSPWLGTGPMQFAMLGRHPNVPGAGTHDFALQFASEWGVPAFLLLAILIATWLFLFSKKIRLEIKQESWRDASIDIAIFAGTIAAIVHGLVANVMNDPVSQLAAVVLIGISMPATISVTSGFNWRYTLARTVLALFCFAGLLATPAVGWRCINPAPNTYQQPLRGSTISPRLWSQGLIPFDKTCRNTSVE